MCKIIKKWYNYALVSDNDKDLWFSQSVNLSTIEKLSNMFSDCHVEKWYWRRNKNGDFCI